MKILFLVPLLISFLNAEWLIVNNDGTLSSYNNTPYENNYAIPKEDINDEAELSTTIIVKKHKRTNKRKKRKIIITDSKVRDKTVYLTFDDGPLNGTQNVISILEESGIDATMFMIGKHVEQNSYRKRLFKRAINDDNILVANHTYSHASGHYRRFYSDDSRVVSDLRKMDRKLSYYDPLHTQKICRLAGRNVFRLPHIYKNDPAVKRAVEYRCYNALKNNGFKIFGWDYQWDYSPKNAKLKKTPRQIVNIMERLIKRGRTKKPNKLILLTHDFTFKKRFRGDQKLRELISLLKERGWGFETLENY
ncbi:MAG: hypothetical protein DSZ06_03315 [Sulfurospirillum sp.]|nr:MAG: hypothetical protein DSZ06_03315 [Sulfurospirillum sp.]